MSTSIDRRQILHPDGSRGVDPVERSALIGLAIVRAVALVSLGFMVVVAIL